jgi:hypothetical protein
MNNSIISVAFNLICILTAISGGTVASISGDVHSPNIKSAAAVTREPIPQSLVLLRRHLAERLSEPQCFALARRSLVEGRAAARRWFAAGHRSDYVAGKYYSLVGGFYAKALRHVRNDLARAVPVPKADQAAAIAHMAWWHFRSASSPEYPHIISELRRAITLNPSKAIYWAMLARVTWWERKEPCGARWTRVVKLLKHATSLNPKCAVAYWMLGQHMVSGPHYDAMKLKSPYDLKAASHYDRLCYANRTSFNHFFFYYSNARIQNVIWNVREALGLSPPNTHPPRRRLR